MDNQRLYDFLIEELKKEDGGVTLSTDFLIFLRDNSDRLQLNLRNGLLDEIGVKYVFSKGEVLRLDYDLNSREFVRKMKIDFAAEIAALPPPAAVPVPQDSALPA